jgi:ribosomal protein S18 acetylase RimI-like enzyme
VTFRGNVIRPARPDDIALLQRLDSVAQDVPGRSSAIAAWVHNGAAFCAVADVGPVGYAVLTQHFFGQPFLELVMVDPAYRRRGVGRQLIRHAINSAPGPMLWTSTNASNLPMQNLLADLGFVRSGIVEGLDQGDPELIFRIGSGG